MWYEQCTQSQQTIAVSHYKTKIPLVRGKKAQMASMFVNIFGSRLDSQQTKLRELWISIFAD